ncbi:MAG: zinc-ribbon domain-containing protein [Pseudomonadota bacterium]
MRLTCPNCGAQYEVPAEVIPETGRDVQCSDCGTTWFQHHPDHPAAEDPVEFTAPEPAAREYAAPDTDDAAPTAHDEPAKDTGEDTGDEDYGAEDDHDDDLTPHDPQIEQEFEPDIEPDAESDIEPAPSPDPDRDPAEAHLPESEPDFAADPSHETEPHEAFDTDPDPEPVDTAEPVDEPDHAEEPEPLGEPEPDEAGTEHDSATAPEDDTDATEPVDLPDAAATDDAVEEASADPVETASDDGGDTDADAQASAGSGAEDPVPAEPTRQRLDENIAAVLRQEAEREARAREDERQSGLETQQDLGLPEQDASARKRTEEAQARMARLRGDDTVAAPAMAEDLDIDPASRSNLLPDIEEINSSLDTQDKPARSDSPDATATPPQKSGFRTGFRIAVLLALVALLVYIFAPQLGSAVPQAESALSSYSDAVDSLRARLAEFAAGLATPEDTPSQ